MSDSEEMQLYFAAEVGTQSENKGESNEEKSNEEKSIAKSLEEENSGNNEENEENEENAIKIHEKINENSNEDSPEKSEEKCEEKINENFSEKKIEKEEESNKETIFGENNEENATNPENISKSKLYDLKYPNESQNLREIPKNPESYLNNPELDQPKNFSFEFSKSENSAKNKPESQEKDLKKQPIFEEKKPDKLRIIM